MNSPNANRDFRPSANRAIYIVGIIDRPMVERLTSQIVSFCLQSREPITVFIDSPGGNIFHADLIFQLLATPSQDSPLPCRLVTVALSLAASAASDLLIAGNYALAYPHSTVMCHGVRQSGDENELTRERAIDLAKRLVTIS